VWSGCSWHGLRVALLEPCPLLPGLPGSPSPRDSPVLPGRPMPPLWHGPLPGVVGLFKPGCPSAVSRPRSLRHAGGTPLTCACCPTHLCVWPHSLGADAHWPRPPLAISSGDAPVHRNPDMTPPHVRGAGDHSIPAGPAGRCGMRGNAECHDELP